MPISMKIKRIVSAITNQPPPYDPDVDEHVGATSGKRYILDYDETRRSSRGSISFDETRRPSAEYRLGRTMTPMTAGAKPRTLSPGTISANLSDAGVRGGSISSIATGGSNESNSSSEGPAGAAADGTRRGSAAVVNGTPVVRKNSLTQRQVRPDGLRCQICKELLTYEPGHKLNPLDNGLFCNNCVSASRHTDPRSFTDYSLQQQDSAPAGGAPSSPLANEKVRSSLSRVDSDKRKSSLSSNRSGKENGAALSKTKSNASNTRSLSDTGPMPDPDALFDLRVVRPFHLGGYFPVRCSKCGESYEICHDRYAGARCTLCSDPVFDICGTCLGNPENGAYMQLLRHKQEVHQDFGDRPANGAKVEGTEGKWNEEKGGKTANGVVHVLSDDHEDVDPMDGTNMAKEAGEGGKKVMEWILYQPPGRIIGPAWRVAAIRNSVSS